MILTDSFEQPGGMWFNPGYLTRLDQREVLPATPLTLPRSAVMPSVVNATGEWPASLLPDEIRSGRLKALIVLGSNLITSLPATEDLESALDALDVMVVLDVFANETSEHASHLFSCPDQLERPDLPGLDLYVCARGTQFTEAMVPAAPGRPPAWRTLADLADRLGFDLLGDLATLDTEAVLDRVARGVDLDDLRALDGAPAIEERSVHRWAFDRLPNGGWDLAPAPLVAQLAALDERAGGSGLVLTPRRQLRRENARAYRDGEVMEAWLHPDDAEPRGISDGDLVEISAAAGSLEVPVRVTDRVRRGVVSLPHGYAERNVNNLISARDLDELSGMPRLSGTVVELSKAALVV